MNPEKLKKMLKLKCTGCGGCCTNSVVPVTDGDVKRLIKHTGLKADDIVRFCDITVIDFESDAEQWVRFDYGKRAMALKKKHGRCMFLDEDNRCTVYQARPATCRTFPLQIELDEDGNFDSITLNRMIKRQYPSGKPKPQKEILKHARLEEREDNGYFKKVERFNTLDSRPGKAAFLKFLGLS